MDTSLVADSPNVYRHAHIVSLLNPIRILAEVRNMVIYSVDAICMNLIALGEAVKGLDKQTHGELLPKYPEVYWSGVMRMRDKIAHHYFEIDTDVVFRTIQEDIPQMKVVVDKIIYDLNEK